MTDTKNFYITTPIYYVNADPHIGSVYTSVACDVMARFKRMDGYKVFFLTGTDEYGQKVEQAATKNGMEPLEFTNRLSERFRAVLPLLNISNDDFIRTTEERHKIACQALWKQLEASGNIYLGKYAGWYAMRDEAYYSEDELRDGPNGKKIAPSGAECEWVEEPSYFFKLSEWGERLLKLYEENPDFIMPQSRRNEVMSFVKSGMHDLSISRTALRWGVPVPDAPGHVMYVWLDALTNYISALGFPNTAAEKYKAFWPVDVHMVGKDIVRFHAVYWPAFLMAAGLPVPKRVFAHGWWTNEGQKISKSLGNVIDPYDLVNTYGVDQTRYFLMREVPFGNDGDFSHDALIRRINSELANDFGNLAQRTLSMINKNCDAAVPSNAKMSDVDRTLLQDARDALKNARELLDRQAFSKVLDGLWDVIGKANRYVDEQAPWGLKKTDPERMQAVLYTLAECLRRLALSIWAFMPESMGKLLDQLAIPEAERTLAAILDEKCQLKPGTPLPAPSGIFPRYLTEAEKQARGHG